MTPYFSCGVIKVFASPKFKLNSERHHTIFASGHGHMSACPWARVCTVFCATRGTSCSQKGISLGRRHLLLELPPSCHPSTHPPSPISNGHPLGQAVVAEAKFTLLE
ncbi:unnamed protein product [Pleuronectes platessa]|uniref:Uncharacterized protein n=1 Tax=Pleuronectes platessa TaxID=8262 RepID=A0A9N7YL40_PLEPL|nr:unnamed protein product [Pleuronectes platessa]